MSDSPAFEFDPTLVCESEIWMRDACAGEPSYQTAVGKRYCVLHFPDKDKGDDFERALKKKLEDKDFNFSGVWFPNPLSFFKFDFDGHAIFNSATFNAAADFRSATFKTQASFNSASFSAAANFDNATFSAEALFSAASFNGGALFNAATFKAAAYFRSTMFRGPTDFRSAAFSAAAYFNAVFDAAADFSESIFSAAAYFSSAIFNAAAIFRKAKFSAKAYFGNATFTATVNFRKASFGKEVNFGSATFSAADFRESSFEAKADFIYSTFSAAADFTSATFGAAADFRSNTFSADAEFINCTLSGKTDFSDATFRDYVRFAGNESRPIFSATSSLDLQFARVEKPDHLSFHTLSLRPHWFVNVDTRSFEFINIKWQFGARQEVKDLNLGEYGLCAPASHMLPIAFRHLAVNAEDNHRYEEASRFRYMAMDVRRREQWHGFAFWRLSWWYWLASGYGERVSQAFLVLLGILLLSAALYNHVGFARWEPRLASESDVTTSKRDAVGAPLPLPRSLAYSAAVMTFQKPEPRPATVVAQTVVLLETILGPVQAALLALAIRRKFMR